MVSCPSCDSAIDVEEEDLDEGDTITCEECGADLRVVGVHPLEMEPVEDEDEEEDKELDIDEDEEDERWH